MRKILSYLVVGLAGLAVAWAGDAPTPAKPSKPHPLLQEALTGPWREITDIVFAVRTNYDDGHWYANIGYYCDDEQHKAYTGGGAPDVGQLCRLNLRTGQLQTLLDAKGGGIRDPQVHYDGQKIVFAWRQAGTDFYHLHEIGVDGEGLRQLTSGDFDDIEPTYLPDGGIVFISTRCKRWVNCWMTQVATLHRCDANGRNIRAISANTEQDNTPWPLPDGRILYTRWEYVDRSQVEYHALWTANPDGTGPTIFYGNMHSWTVMIDAKPIPDSRKILANFSPGHGVNEHAGYPTMLSSDGGADDLSQARSLRQAGLVRDPYPLSEHLVLASRKNELVLLDDAGRLDVIYAWPGPGGLHEPRPLQARPRERRLVTRALDDLDRGQMVLADVYQGRHMEGVKRGDIKKLLVLEQLPKQVNFSGGQDLTSFLGTFSLERILGVVPVEADGSAYLEVPANRPVFFVALDKDDLSVKRMQSWASVAPGEVTGCIGCHESRPFIMDNGPRPRLQALNRPVSKPVPFEGFPDVMDFPRDIQPILDRHCVKCHQPSRRDGKLLLTGDLGAQFSHSYFTLMFARLVADGRNGLGNQPPRALGSAASPLLKYTHGGHYDAKLSDREWRTLWLWIESGAPYAGSYAGLRNAAQQQVGEAAVQQVFGKEHAVLQRRCASCHPLGGEKERALPYYRSFEGSQSKAGRPVGAYERVVLPHEPMLRYSPMILLNFSRPEFSSLLLAPLPASAGGFNSCGKVFENVSDPDYQLLLAAIKRGQALLDAEPRYGTPKFQPNRQYVREMKKYGVLPISFDLAKDKLDIFDADQQYWKSLWWQRIPSHN